MSVVNVKLEYFKVSDGLRLYYHRWMPEEPKAIIVFVHGLTDHVGRYEPFTRYFTERGYGVCLFDMRGHGKSEGRRAHVARFHDYLYDLSQFVEFIKKSSPSAPIFLVGHSFGGQVVLNFVVRYAKGIRGVVALSPNVEMKINIPRWKLKLGAFGAKWFPILRVGCRVVPETLSHDQAVVEKYATDPNVVRDITLRCGQEIMKNSELVMALASRINLPLLLMHGGDDKICDAEAAKKFYMRVPANNKQIKIYPGLYHELLNERDKYQVYADMESWFEGQLDIEFRMARASGRKGD